MAATEPGAIVRLGPAEVAGGLRLSTEAHWNQNEADWRFFLRDGFTFGIHGDDGALRATAALLPHNATDAWISMVLVTQSARRQGLATRLVDRCLAEAAARQLTTWLDATPAGAAVYGPLGFVGILELRRLRLTTAERGTPAAPLAACGLTELLARDTAAMGFARDQLLAELSGRDGSRLVSNGDAVALLREGRTARQIGPLFADTCAAALALVDAIAAATPGPLLLDALTARDGFIEGLEQRGWKVERPFLRMRHGGPSDIRSQVAYAVAGPEYG